MKKSYSSHIELDQALLLVTKEFDGDTDYIYRFYESDNDWCFEKLLPGDLYDSFSMTPAPTYAEVFRWLREEKGLCVVIQPMYDSLIHKDKNKYVFTINVWDTNKICYLPESSEEFAHKFYDTYEDAEEDALNFILSSLI